jgi:hypothetical protein
MKKIILAALILASFSAMADDTQYIKLDICKGTSSIHQGLHGSKLFMILDNSQKVAYSNQYGSHGTTDFKYYNGLNETNAFEKGVKVTYSGVKDASGICSPYSLAFR